MIALWGLFTPTLNQEMCDIFDNLGMYTVQQAAYKHAVRISPNASVVLRARPSPLYPGLIFVVDAVIVALIQRFSPPKPPPPPLWNCTQSLMSLAEKIQPTSTEIAPRQQLCC